MTSEQQRDHRLSRGAARAGTLGRNRKNIAQVQMDLL